MLSFRAHCWRFICFCRSYVNVKFIRIRDNYERSNSMTSQRRWHAPLQHGIRTVLRTAIDARGWEINLRVVCWFTAETVALLTSEYCTLSTNVVPGYISAKLFCSISDLSVLQAETAYSEKWRFFPTVILWSIDVFLVMRRASVVTSYTSADVCDIKSKYRGPLLKIYRHMCLYVAAASCLGVITWL